MLLGRVGASLDPRASAGLRAPPESATACNTVPPLTVEFHSISSACGAGYPHPGRRPGSIAMPRSPLGFTAFRVVVDRVVHMESAVSFDRDAAAHRRNSQRSELSWVGLFTPESARSFDRWLPLTVEFHSVSSCRGLGCPHPNRYPRSSACRCSPSKFTGFLVSGVGDIHTYTCASFGCANAGTDERQSRATAGAGMPIRAGAGTRDAPAELALALPRRPESCSGATHRRTAVWISRRRIDSQICASDR